MTHYDPFALDDQFIVQDPSAITAAPARFTSPDQLWNWIDRTLGLQIPRTPVCPDHQAPFDYLCHSYFEPASDVIVWAPRGGGKTRLGALATLLDLYHKSPASIRILGGSLDQSLRMWEHLLPDVQNLFGDDLHIKSTSIKIPDAGSVAVLTQSERAVRGLRVQKLRCDEVELFTPRIWNAAQLVTRSIRGTHPQWPDIRGVIEVFSTMHEPFGLMQRIIDQAHQRGTRIIKWCLLDVLEQCPPQRDCSTCPLWEECQGRAKTHCHGHIRIDDAIDTRFCLKTAI